MDPRPPVETLGFWVNAFFVGRERFRPRQKGEGSNFNEEEDEMLTAVVGVNWGDEGKGRMVDLLSQDQDIVVR